MMGSFIILIFALFSIFYNYYVWFKFLPLMFSMSFCNIYLEVSNIIYRKKLLYFYLIIIKIKIKVIQVY